jgi:hypothetical protein
MRIEEVLPSICRRCIDLARAVLRVVAMRGLLAPAACSRIRSGRWALSLPTAAPVSNDRVIHATTQKKGVHDDGRGFRDACSTTQPRMCEWNARPTAPPRAPRNCWRWYGRPERVATTFAGDIDTVTLHHDRAQ